MNHPLFTLRISIGSEDSLADIESQLHKFHTSGALHTTYTSMLLCSIPTRSGVFNQKKIIIQKSDFHCPEHWVSTTVHHQNVYENSKTGFIRIFLSLFFPSPYQHLQCCMIFLIALKISILHERNGPNNGNLNSSNIHKILDS